MTNNEIKLQNELDKINEEIAKEQKQQILPNVMLRLERESKRLRLERELAKIRNVEYAENLEIDLRVGFDWYAISSFRKDSYLFCDLLGDSQYNTLVLRFIESVETRFGGLNDEVFDQHPLYGRGLNICGFFVVKNSDWRYSLQTKMKSHDCYSEKFWSRINHYLFRDKGGEISCLATGFEYWLSPENIDLFRKRFYFNIGSSIPPEGCSKLHRIS